MKWVSIGSDNGLPPVRCQSISWTMTDLLSIGPLGTNFRYIRIEIHFLFVKMHLKMSSAKQFCLGVKTFSKFLISHGFFIKIKCDFVVRIVSPASLNSKSSTDTVMSKFRFHEFTRQTLIEGLTHWGWDKMDAIFQTTFSNAFSWMKIYEFRLSFHWSLFLSVQLTIFQHWFR